MDYSLGNESHNVKEIDDKFLDLVPVLSGFFLGFCFIHSVVFVSINTQTGQNLLGGDNNLLSG